MKSSSIAIGEAATRLGVAAHVLRHWEDVGLVAPARLSRGQRSYRRRDLIRLAAIVRAKQAGLSLEEIRSLLDGTAASRQATLRDRREALAARIAEDRGALAMLDLALDCEHGDIGTCPRLQAQLSQSLDPPSG